MIKGIGTDLVEIERIKALDINRFIKRILSSEEQKIYNEISNEERQLTFLAGRFAAKEALFKAFKKGNKDANLKDFSILNDSDGAPYVSSIHLNGLNVHLSITHTNTYAIAFVVLEYI